MPVALNFHILMSMPQEEQFKAPLELGITLDETAGVQESMCTVAFLDSGLGWREEGQLSKEVGVLQRRGWNKATGVLN